MRGAFGYRYRPALPLGDAGGPITVTPAPGAVVVAGQAPTVSLSGGPISVTPATGSVVVAGLLPTVAIGSAPITVTPAAGAVVVAGLAPTASLLAATITVTPAPGAVVVAGRLPIVVVGTIAETPVRTAILDAIVAALNAAGITIGGDALTVELGRTDAVPEGARPLLAVIGGDMQPTEGGDTMLTRYEMRLLLAGYLAATTQAAAEQQANLLHASVVRALVRPNPAAPPVSIMLADGITDVIVEELAMRVEPASVTQSEAPMADLAAEFLAIVNTEYGNPFIAA